MEPKNSLKISSQGNGKIKMEEGFSTLLVKPPVTGQNLSTQGIRSVSDCKLLDANLAMHIKEEKEEVVMGLDESLVTSTQELDKKVKIEPEMGANLLTRIGDLKNLKSEINSEVCQAVPGKGGGICFKVEEGSAVKENQCEETMEALDLSLPKKRDRSFKGRCVWLTGDDAANESSLVMEVDEIEELRTEPEVEEDDDSSCDFGEMQWGDMQVSNIVSLAAPLDDTMAEDVLLIDIEGVPYTLTPDGTKVPQTDPDEQTEQPDSTVAAEKDQPSSSSALTKTAHSQPNLSHSSDLPDNQLSCTTSAQVVVSKSSPVLTNLSQLSVLPALSSLPSQPIQVIANSTSNTPILLLPSSQLQAAASSSSSSSGEANTGLMALSLPLTLAQNAQSSSPMFLVLSSLPVSSGQTAVTQLPVLDGNSGQLSQISSVSSVTLPLSASLPSVRSTLMASNSPVFNLLVPESQGSASLGSNKLASPSPVTVTVSPAASSNVNSTSHSRHLVSDKSDSWTPKSFREALLNSCPESRTVHPPDTQPQKPEVPATSCLSPSNPGPVSPLVTPDLSEPLSAKGHLLPKPEPEPVPISEQVSDSVSSQDEQLVSSSSPTPPVSPPLAQNDPGDQQKYSPPSPTGANRRVLYCRYCPRIFYYLSDLERHSITHSQNKPHVCPLCGKAFKRSSHLERHKHIHTGQRNFVCSICSKRFREAGELLRHQRVHTGEKPFQCSLCHMRFAERNTLRRHTKRKHQGREQEAMEADGGRGGTTASQALVLVQQEESAEWYSSTVPEQDSDSEPDGDGDGDGDGD